MDNHNRLILISGGSQSGKSSLASWLKSVLPGSEHLEQDFYVLPTEQIPRIRNRINWESPESIDWEKWDKSIKKALQQYQYVIAEGLFVRHHKASVEQASCIIELAIPYPFFIQRRLNDKRWGTEPEWYLKYVWESNQYIEKLNQGEADMSFTFVTQPDYVEIYEHIISLSFA